MHTRSGLLQQQLCHLGGHAAVFNDVAFQQHAATRLCDGVFHGAEGGRPVHQQSRAVAAVEVDVATGAEHLQVQSQEVFGAFCGHAAQRARFLGSVQRA